MLPKSFRQSFQWYTIVLAPPKGYPIVCEKLLKGFREKENFRYAYANLVF